MQALSATDGAPRTNGGRDGRAVGNTPETPTAAPQNSRQRCRQSSQRKRRRRSGKQNTLAGSAGSASNIAVSDSLSVHAGAIGDEVYVVQYAGRRRKTARPTRTPSAGTPCRTELAAPSRLGAAFAGWYEDAGLYNRVTALDPARIASALGGENKPYVLYAKWTPIEYDITYDLDGG